MTDEMNRLHDIAINATGEVRWQAQDTLSGMADNLETRVSGIAASTAVDGVVPEFTDPYWLEDEKPAWVARYLEISDELHLDWRLDRPVLWLAADAIASTYWRAYTALLAPEAG